MWILKLILRFHWDISIFCSCQKLNNKVIVLKKFLTWYEWLSFFHQPWTCRLCNHWPAYNVYLIHDLYFGFYFRTWFSKVWTTNSCLMSFILFFFCGDFCFLVDMRRRMNVKAIRLDGLRGPIYRLDCDDIQFSCFL